MPAELVTAGAADFLADLELRPGTHVAFGPRRVGGEHRFRLSVRLGRGPEVVPAGARPHGLPAHGSRRPSGNAAPRCGQRRSPGAGVAPGDPCRDGQLTKSSRFGEPEPGLVTTPVVARLTRVLDTWAGV
ncbi:hypothetical protein SAMN05444365_105238 [Micromonospora pattaloongensis]|uniref:Uncharacterized protein n=1 Tax=Micromonospora pattaloongensis TaxID=405436 RepID=A0A1H3Q4H4_9ACTN|nr:hypothetical protein SAMN05444365_105238 [Micromonospora pattaloongensis]